MQSVYGLMQSPKLQRSLSYLNSISKSLAVLLPILAVGLLQLRSLKHHTVWYLITCDVLCELPSTTRFRRALMD